MRLAFVRSPLRAGCRASILAVGAWLAVGCSAGSTGLQEVRAVGDPGQPLVSPRWTGDGRLLAAGRGGQGRYALDLQAGRLEPVPDVREPRPEARKIPAGTRDLEGEVLWSQDGAAVLWDEYRGRLVHRTAAGSRLLAEAGAWGAQVARTGAVAFCTGPRLTARLHVFLPERRAAGLLDLGPGVDPAWFPGGDLLVYAIATWGDRPDSPVEQSDLYLWEPGSGRRVQLTATPDVAELQPTVAPDGSRLAYADWRSGRLFVAAWGGLPAEP